MKLATLKNGGRDGRLVIVSRDLTRYTDASFLASNLQAALDDWDRIAPHLAAVSESLDHGAVPSERFHEHDAMAPLPRAHLWADGSAYPSHMELIRKARNQPLPENHLTEPLMYLGAGDAMLGARDPIPAISEAWGIDLEGEIAVITGDVPLGVSPQEALGAIRLVMIANDISYRNLVGPELAKGFGFCQSKGPTAFSPVAVTPDELGQRLGRRQGVPASERPGQRRCAWAGRCGPRHGLRFRPADRPCRQDASGRRRRDHRLGHGVEPLRRWRIRKACERGRRGLLLPCRAAHV